MSKKIMLPLFMRNDAIQIALATCEMEGLNPPKGFKPEEFDQPRWLDSKGLSKEAQDYLDCFHEAVYTYCKENYMHSLTPSGELHANPGSAQMSKHVYKAYPFYGPNGFIEKYTSGLNEAQKKGYVSQFKSSIMHLTMLFLRLKAKKTNDDFAYPEKATLAVMKKAVLNRYYRILVNASLHAMIQPLYDANPDEITSFLARARFKGEKTEYSLEKSTLSELQSEDARIAFAKMIHDMVTKKVKSVELGKILFEKT